ncbi:MAG: hypothetical protein PHO33_00220 [Clostridia bacterium]|nr:hypothetical protein [Clostridia bacterium]
MKFKKIFAILTLSALLATQNGAFFSIFANLLSVSKNTVFADSSVETEIELSNSDFLTSSGTTYPKIPSNWTVVNPNTISDIKAGIISLDVDEYTDNYSENYELNISNPQISAELQGNSDYNVLMINSANAFVSYGYKSTSLTLSASSYYEITAYVYTPAEIYGGCATVKLSGNNISNADAIFTGVVTNQNWTRYTFYVETNSTNSETVNIELWLGNEDGTTAKGVVLFDNISVMSLAESAYKYKVLSAIISDPDENYIKTISLKNIVINNPVANDNFETTSEIDWTLQTASDLSPYDRDITITGIYNISDNFDTVATGIEESPKTNNSYQNKNALLINNIESNAVGYKSSDIAILSQGYYLLSIFVKTSNLTSGVTIKAVEQFNEIQHADDYEVLNASLSNITTTSVSNSLTNDWQKVSIYIKGNPLYNSVINLEIWLGVEDSLEKGYAFFDDVSLEAITKDEYEDVSAGSYITTLSLNSISGTLNIANGTFNFGEVTEPIVSDTNTYPLQPTDWTQSSIDDNFADELALSGIINTNATNFSAHNYIGAVNPGFTPSQYDHSATAVNNVLMIGNLSATAQTYTSESYSLSASSYYKLSVMVSTDIVTGGGAVISLQGTIYDLTEFNSISNDNWTTYYVYIKTGLTGIEVTVALSLGKKDNLVNGFAYFDNCFLVSSDETVFTAKQANCDADTEKVIDLSSEEFALISNTSSQGLYDPLLWDLDADDQNVIAGVLKTNELEQNSSFFPGMQNPGTNKENSGNVLMLSSNEDVYATYSALIAQTLTASSYYKISIWVKTYNMSQLNENQELDEENEILPYGVQISLSGTTVKFTGIDTEADGDNAEYEEYVFYVNATSALSTTITLGLGADNALTSGTVFFDAIYIVAIEETDYTDAVTQITSDNPPSNMLNVGDTETPADTEEDTTDETEDETSYNWLIFPTLIFSVAFILAIVMVMLRRIEFKKRVKAQSSEYDRDKSIYTKNEK